MFKGKGIRNIEVCKLMLSLKSREFVEEDFSWQHYYWTLTDKVTFFNVDAPKKVNGRQHFPFLFFPRSAPEQSTRRANPANDASDKIGGRGEL